MKTLTEATKTLELIEDFIGRRQLVQASDLIRNARRSMLRSQSPDIVVRFYVVDAHCKLLMSDYGSAIIKAKTAERLSSRLSDLGLYARIKRLIGAIRQAQGLFDEAIAAYTESLAFLKKTLSYSEYYKPIHNIALIHLAKGDLDRACQLLSQALAYAERFNNQSDAKVCRVNLIRSFTVAGRFKDAAEQLAFMEESSSDAYFVQTQCTKSLLLTSRLDYGAAYDLLTWCFRELTELRLHRDVAVCLEYLGLNEYFAGNYEKARDYYNQVLAMPEPTASAVAQTLRMLTDVEVAEGNWDKAEATAGQAEAAILKISEKIELGALWRAYGEIYTHKQDYAKAREFFEKSIDLLKALGARYELALSHLVAGQSASFTQEQRIEQLQAAKALFIEMEVPKRIEQVDRLLSALALQAKTKITIKSRNGKGPSLPMIVESAGMRRVIEIADRIKDTEKGVLITGETGTGKDLLAQYIHQTSLRKDKPFVTINSANFQESLVESELFGYAKGSFTSSTKDKPGLIETAQGGTFVFDEIGELPMYLQAKLLRVVDTKVIRRLGENEDRPVDVRFIALTNRNLEAMVLENKFRSDLLYRLNEVHLVIPPMRERPEDLFAILMRLLAEQEVTIAAEDVRSALQSLNGYSWPGNVRQLQKLATDVGLAAAQQSPIEALRDLLWQMPGHNGASPTPEHSDAYLREVLARNNGNYARAARELGIPVSTLRYRLGKSN